MTKPEEMNATEYLEEKFDVEAKGHKPTYSAVDMVQFAEEYHTLKSQEEVGPWPPKDVLAKLLEATDILLHKHDYDGHGWEEMEHCWKLGKETLRIASGKELSK